MRFRLLLLSHFFLLIFATDAFTQQCRVQGVVRAASGAPYGGITVQIDGPDYRKPVPVTADDEGRFVFENVKAGERVRVTAIRQGRAIALEWRLVTSWVETVDLTEVSLTTSPNSLDYLLASDGPSGIIVGYVRAANGTAAGARVTINETPLTTVTDSAGRFAIDGLRAGITVNVHASAPGFAAAQLSVVVPDGGQSSANFLLVPASAARSPGDAGAVEIAPLSPGPDTAVISFERTQVPAFPSTNRDDVFRTLQFLPAIAATTDAAVLLSVRGSSPDETRVSMDGITLYQMADADSGPTPFDTEAVAKGELAKSPFGALDGGRLAGALRLSGTSASHRPAGFVEMSALGAAAGLQLPVGRWFSAALNVRQSGPADLYADTLESLSARVGEPVRARQPRFAGGPLSTAPTEPSFRDIEARFQILPSSRDRITLSLYDGKNDADRSYDEALPAPTVGTIGVPQENGLPDAATIEASMVQRWTSRGWSGAWNRSWSASASSTFTFARSEYSKSASEAWIVTNPVTGQDYTYTGDRGGSSGLVESNDVAETTFRADNGVTLGFAHALAFGAEISSFDINYQALGEAAETVGADPPNSGLVNLLRQSGSGRVISFFVHDSWRPLSRLSIAPGARVVSTDYATYVEPRVTASYQLRPDFRFTGGWSIDHQMVNRIEREDRAHGDGGFWALADGGAIPAVRAQQATAGLNVTRAGVSFDLSGFYKQLDDLTLFAPRLYTGTVPVGGAAASLYKGSGTAAGIEGIVQHRVERNVLWIGYTLSRVSNSFPALETGTFPANLDQLHELKVADDLEIARNWSIGAAFAVSTGRPYTAASSVETVWFPTGAVVSQVVFGEKNAARLPAYHRLDVSARRDFTLGHIGLSLGATVFNVYDQDSVIGVNYDSIGGTLTSHDVTQMGRAINAFLRVGF